MMAILAKEKPVMNVLSLKKTKYFSRKLNKELRRSRDTMKYLFRSEKTMSVCQIIEPKQNKEHKG